MLYTKKENFWKVLDSKLPEEFKHLSLTAQFEGYKINSEKLKAKLVRNEDFNEMKESSPENIITCFKNDNFLQALALIIVWGGMSRTVNVVYKESLSTIEDTLRVCKSKIQESGSIQEAWELLETKLAWTRVMISKVLHFMCRSLGYEDDAVVPIDKAVILDKVWPIVNVNNYYPRCLWIQSKKDNRTNWDGYCYYMTFIEYLRENYYPQWTNTNVENALFAEFGR